LNLGAPDGTIFDENCIIFLRKNNRLFVAGARQEGREGINAYCDQRSPPQRVRCLGVVGAMFTEGLGEGKVKRYEHDSPGRKVNQRER